MEHDIEVYGEDNVYEYDNNIMMHYYPKRIIQLLDSSKSCLELGIGHGYTTTIFSQYFKRHVVLDGDKDIIDRFRNKFPDIETQIIKTYFEDWETKDKFDVIIMGFVLEHVKEPQIILNKYKKILKQNGKIFIIVPNAEALNRRVGKEAGILTELTELSENDIRLGHKRYYSLKTLLRECQEAGLKAVRQEGIYLKPVTTKQMVSLKLSKEIINGFLAVGKDYPELSLGILLEVTN